MEWIRNTKKPAVPASGDDLMSFATFASSYLHSLAREAPVSIVSRMDVYKALGDKCHQLCRINEIPLYVFISYVVGLYFVSLTG